jgi:hypothetical protein
MIELGNQYALVFLHPLALGHIDGNANNPLRAPLAIVGNDTTPLDPPDLAVRANNAVRPSPRPPLVSVL